MLENWITSFGGCEPIGHLLRETRPDRWVRFHSLPGSKRYAESEAEYRILLDRHNAILGELAREGEPLILLTTEFTDVPAPDVKPAHSPASALWRIVPIHDPPWESQPFFLHVYATEMFWRSGRIDPIIRSVADDVQGNVMICDTDCRWVLHPYDGGMDVILWSVAARDQLKEKFRGWLSVLPSGL